MFLGPMHVFVDLLGSWLFFDTIPANKYMYHANNLHSHISLLHVRRTKERERMLEYITIELQKWHPTPRRNVNRSDYYDVAPLDTIWPDPPLNVVGIPRVRLTSLV